MTALYSVNLHIMGRSNVPLLGQKTLATYAEGIGTTVLGGRTSLNVGGWEVSSLDASVLALTFAAIVLVGGGLFAFSRPIWERRCAPPETTVR